MGLPMFNRPPKASPSDEETSNKPSLDHNNTEARPPVYPFPRNSASTSATSSTASVEDPTIRWERLQGLRNRLVDRMYRLEMDEASNTTHGNNNRAQDTNNGEGSSMMEATSGNGSSGNGSEGTQAASRPIPIPTGRPIQVSSTGEALLRSWVSLNRTTTNVDPREALNSARTEGERHSTRQARRDSRRRLETRRAAAAAAAVAAAAEVVDNRDDALITVDEFLRGLRDPISDNEEADVTPTGSRRSSSIPQIDRLRSAVNSRIERRSPSNRTETNSTPSQDGRLDIIRPSGGGISAVPQTLPVTTLWSATTAPPEQQSPPTETFDTFISHIRRIGSLQDAMLATMRSSNSTLATDAASSSGAAAPSTTNSSGIPSTSPAVNQATETINSGASSAATRPAVISTTRSTASATGTSNAAPGSTTSPPFLGTAEARLRAMQARIDILTSEFSLLRSTWAMSHAENQSYERSLRRLQELIPSARRAERLRRGNRSGEVSLLYEDLHADAAAREGELFPRNPWEDSIAERNRERLRMIAASAWPLERDAPARNENAGSTARQGSTGGDDRNQAAATTVNTTIQPQPFSPAERVLQQEMLAAKMVELTLKGMR